MTISHPKITIQNADELVIFAKLADVSCSVCAPMRVRKEEIEAFATAQLGEPIGGWEAVDKSKIPGFGSKTPNPCNQYEGRQHWLLFNGLVTAQFGLPTKK